ncbi:MAG TPA: methylaspartate mutase subunit E, partial [Firmicutes bacterium]|nr:methylaspartate mutase subunit E [Bacillota bacterium]
AAAGGVARLAREQCRSILPALKQEEELIAAEAGAVLARVEELGAGDLVAGVTGALAEGSLDLPLAPSGVCRGQVLAARDLEGAVRFLDPGCLPLPAAVKEFHREKLARRARAEGREPAVSMVIDDIYALNKGFLVGHPE